MYWRCGLGPWRTQVVFCTVLSGPASSSFFRFDVLVTAHLCDPLQTGSLTVFHFFFEPKRPRNNEDLDSLAGPSPVAASGGRFLLFALISCWPKSFPTESED